MLRVFETFSGIGAQAKALSNIGCEHKIVATSDWDITAIIAYDLIHNGAQDLSYYAKQSKSNLIKQLSAFTLSNDGKKPATKASIASLSKNTAMHLLAAINRTNNLISITDVHANQIPSGMNLLTYSFPCQDLSIAHSWHGETKGIDRNANNRSSMLWEIERILREYVDQKIELPTFLLMENVPAILSQKHKKNFSEWLRSLNEMGYYNVIYRLRASKFGSAQDRERVYMISVNAKNDQERLNKLIKYFNENNLAKRPPIPQQKLKNILKTDYSNPVYYKEAEASCPNDTPSRREIYKNNIKLYDGKKYAKSVKTITTKQDRHPNSGVINFKCNKPYSSNFRYLTPRECLLLMGFSDDDYENIVNNNFSKRDNSKTPFFTQSKIVKLAGNSIVVNVLEEVFKQIDEVNKLFF